MRKEGVRRRRWGGRRKKTEERLMGIGWEHMRLRGGPPLTHTHTHDPCVYSKNQTHISSSSFTDNACRLQFEDEDERRGINGGREFARNEQNRQE